MRAYREQAIVLRTHKLGETDRILHLLSTGRGKVRAVAKGVRRPGSRFGGRLEVLSHVDAQLHPGRTLDVVTQVELVHAFSALRSDWTRSACAQTLAEAADRVAQEGERHVALFVLLRESLLALEADPRDPAAVLDAGLLRLASVAGYHPHLRACARCGAPGEHAVLHLDAGGLLCPACAPVGAQPLAEGVLEGLRVLAEAPWEDLDAWASQRDGRIRRSCAALVSSYLAHHLGAPLKGWELVPR